MDRSGSILRWRLSLAESLSFGVTVAIVVVWSMGYFQSKSEATEWKNSVEMRMGKIEDEVASLRVSIESIGRDTSYIRGRIEPKNEK